MTCLPSLNGCNHNESVSLMETKRTSVEEKSSRIHFCLFSTPTCLYKVEQNLLTDAARPGSTTAGRLLTCGALICRFPVEIVPFNQEASVSSPNMLKNQPFHFQTSSFPSVIMRQAVAVPVIQGFDSCFIRLRFLSVASRNPSNCRGNHFILGEMLKSHFRVESARVTVPL